jgi:hypothetical protein
MSRVASQAMLKPVGPPRLYRQPRMRKNKRSLREKWASGGDKYDCKIPRARIESVGPKSAAAWLKKRMGRRMVHSLANHERTLGWLG